MQELCHDNPYQNIRSFCGQHEFVFNIQWAFSSIQYRQICLFPLLTICPDLTVSDISVDKNEIYKFLKRPTTQQDINNRNEHAINNISKDKSKVLLLSTPI